MKKHKKRESLGSALAKLSTEITEAQAGKMLHMLFQVMAAERILTPTKMGTQTLLEAHFLSV